MTTSQIITLVVAVYGAVLATVTATVTYLRDRVKVKLDIRKNLQQIAGAVKIGHAIVAAPHYQIWRESNFVSQAKPPGESGGTTGILVRVTNVGRRPVTITTIGAAGLYPNSDLLSPNAQPPLPCDITEGKYIDSFLDQNDINFATIDYWYALDSYGREYKTREASLLKHWKSKRQRQRKQFVFRQ